MWNEATAASEKAGVHYTDWNMTGKLVRKALERFPTVQQSTRSFR